MHGKTRKKRAKEAEKREIGESKGGEGMTTSANWVLLGSIRGGSWLNFPKFSQGDAAEKRLREKGMREKRGRKLGKVFQEKVLAVGLALVYQHRRRAHSRRGKAPGKRKY